MKAAVVESFGRAPRYGDFAEPEAAANESMVRVRAAALSNLVKAIGLKIDTEAVPLSDVESAWNRTQSGRRIVFTI